MTHTPTDQSRAQIKAMYAYSMDEDAICVIMQISPDDLATHYARERALGSIETEVQVKQALFQQARNGNAIAAKAWMEQYGGWY